MSRLDKHEDAYSHAKETGVVSVVRIPVLEFTLKHFLALTGLLSPTEGMLPLLSSVQLWQIYENINFAFKQHFFLS